MDGRRRLLDVLATGALTGLVAGLATGAIDAVWSWAPAAQFVARLGPHTRFVAYTALSYGAAGLVVGLLAAAVLLVLSRGTRLGDLQRFAWAKHDEVRARDPRDATVGVSFVLA